MYIYIYTHMKYDDRRKMLIFFFSEVFRVSRENKDIQY